MNIWIITVEQMLCLGKRKSAFRWIGPKELLFVLEQLPVLHFFMRNLARVSFIVISRGYLAPEYALLGQLTKKADVYSFGVLLLEIISGRSSSKSAWGHEMLVLVEWVITTWNLREEERLLEMVDPEIVGYPQKQLLRFIKVALLCTQAASHRRPSMKQVVDMLSGEGDQHQMSLDLLDVRNLMKTGVSLMKPNVSYW